MASDSWKSTTQIVREETRCHHMGYSFRLTARVLIYAPSHRIAHTMAFVTPVVEHWLEREIAQWLEPKVDRSMKINIKIITELCHLQPPPPPPPQAI